MRNRCFALIVVLGVLIGPLVAGRPVAAQDAPAQDAPEADAPASAPAVQPGPTPEELWIWAMGFPSIPADSGAGRRIVYSIGQQRVWLVETGEQLAKTYLVSGRVGLPGFGTYHVYGRSRFSGSGSVHMEYMIRFARGRSLSIGFHSIPVGRRGRPLQSVAQLGTPRSHGCVRQWIGDAAQLWDWAPIGTTVVVVR